MFLKNPECESTGGRWVKKSQYTDPTSLLAQVNWQYVKQITTFNWKGINNEGGFTKTRNHHSGTRRKGTDGEKNNGCEVRRSSEINPIGFWGMWHQIYLHDGQMSLTWLAGGWLSWMKNRCGRFIRWQQTLEVPKYGNHSHSQVDVFKSSVETRLTSEKKNLNIFLQNRREFW